MSVDSASPITRGASGIGRAVAVAGTHQGSLRAVEGFLAVSALTRLHAPRAALPG